MLFVFLLPSRRDLSPRCSQAHVHSARQLPVQLSLPSRRHLPQLGGCPGGLRLFDFQQQLQQCTTTDHNTLLRSCILSSSHISISANTKININSSSSSCRGGCGSSSSEGGGCSKGSSGGGGPCQRASDCQPHPDQQQAMGSAAAGAWLPAQLQHTRVPDVQRRAGSGCAHAHGGSSEGLEII